MRLLVILFFFAVIYAQSVPSLVWPLTWQTSRNRVVVGPVRTLVSFATYYVDATKNSLRVKEEQCMVDNMLVGECDFYFVQNNVYISVPGNNTCCLLVPNLPPTSPAWLQNLNHTYMGVGMYLGEKANVWDVDIDGGPMMTYYQRISEPLFPFAIVGLNSPTDGLEFFNSVLVSSFSPTVFTLPRNTCVAPFTFSSTGALPVFFFFFF